MNYLAHAFLSFGKPNILAGNMMADFVKGKSLNGFPDQVKAGIRLHRAIDEFTDNHEASHHARELMYAACGRYSGVFTDVIYDHFLALDEHYFNRESLTSFARTTYQTLEEYRSLFPERFQRTFYFMEKYDWLSGYGNDQNIERSFMGIYNRAKYLQESDKAFVSFEGHYDELHECYNAFIPQVYAFASDYLNHLPK